MVFFGHRGLTEFTFESFSLVDIVDPDKRSVANVVQDIGHDRDGSLSEKTRDEKNILNERGRGKKPRVDEKKSATIIDLPAGEVFSSLAYIKRKKKE